MRISPLVIGAMLLSCSSGAREDLSSASQSIVGGQNDSSDPAAVAIFSETVGLTLCSGALIGPRTILTAGHCNFTKITARFGANAATPDREVPIILTLVHPNYTAEGAPYDFALLELETSVTDIAPLPLRTAPLSQTDVGKTVRHVGYGVSDETTGAGLGQKRTVSYPITKVTDTLFYSGAPGEQTCNMDSGAPGLVVDADGVERIAGVVSDGPNCHEDGWDGRADLAALASFVTSTRSSWENAPADSSSKGGCAIARDRNARDDVAGAAFFVVIFCLARHERHKRRARPIA